MPDSYNIPKSVWALAWCCCLVLLVGCSESGQIVTEYGKVSGSAGSASLNGTSVLYDLFLKRGHRVKRRKKISPSIRKYETVVWFPDDRDCPSDEVVNRLNEWLVDGYGRTLIYVGRDYEAQMDYLNQVKEEAPLDQKEEMMRQIAEARMERRILRRTSFFWDIQATDVACEWFERKKLTRQSVKTVDRELAEELDVNKLSIEVGATLAPRDYSAEDYVYSVNRLLDVNDEPFIFEVYDESDDRNVVLAIGNGSFLLNYGLLNSENRKLANRIVDRVDPYGDVLFLESGPGGIEISDSDVTNHNAWAWISEPPLRYIVPHFLFWGILFCFVSFPIFGRPKKLKQESTSTFRSHVDATGKLIERSKRPDIAAARIEKFQETVKDPYRQKKTPDE